MNYVKQQNRKDNIKAYYKNKYIEKKQKEEYIKLKEKDIIYKIISNLSNRIYKEFNGKHIERNEIYSSFIGCCAMDLRDHLEKQFVDGMNYDNYGKWEVDHIIPVSSFNLHDINEAKKCFNYLNLQPLWKEDNMKKSNKILFYKCE